MACNKCLYIITIFIEGGLWRKLWPVSQSVMFFITLLEVCQMTAANNRLVILSSPFWLNVFEHSWHLKVCVVERMDPLGGRPLLTGPPTRHQLNLRIRSFLWVLITKSFRVVGKLGTKT